MKKKISKNRIRLLATFIIFVICAVAAAIPKDTPKQENNYAAAVSFDNKEPSQSIVDASPELIPDYSGEDVIILDGNVPEFTAYDIENISGEHYSDLDSFGRCGTAVAMLDSTMMPQGKRRDIGQIKPSGWVQKKYPTLVDSDPPYIYNRSHLIAYALAGEDLNERNLITGTRYMNATTMLPYEEEVMKYIDDTDNRVLYRVSPYFKDDELVARGVEMEAYSVDDDGSGICYHVFVYNIQPGIEIDYKTGKSWIMR